MDIRDDCNCTKSDYHWIGFSNPVYLQWCYAHDFLYGYHFSRDRFDFITKYVGDYCWFSSIDRHMYGNWACWTYGTKSKYSTHCVLFQFKMFISIPHLDFADSIVLWNSFITYNFGSIYDAKNLGNSCWSGKLGTTCGIFSGHFHFGHWHTVKYQ